MQSKVNVANGGLKLSGRGELQLATGTDFTRSISSMETTLDES
jgi:hypothetical protein